MATPLIINHPEPMARVRIITTKEAAEKTVKILHKIGVMHIEEAGELKPVDRAAIENEKKEVGELLAFVNTILSYIPEKETVFDVKDFEVLYTQPLKEVSGEVRLLYSKVNSLKERIVKLDGETRNLKELKKCLEPLAAGSDIRLIDLNYTGDYMISRVFILSGEAFQNSGEKFQRYLFINVIVTTGSEVVLHVVAEIGDERQLASLVTESGGRAVTLPSENLTVKDFLEANDVKIRNLEAKITELKGELKKRVGEDIERVILLREALSAENERLSVLEKATEARYVTLIEGWIPEKQVEDTTAEVRQETSYVFVDSRPPLDSEQPPTKLNNLNITKPFQVIVDLFGTPKYREWDPTPIIAYSFAFFFGVMTQDVIYAIGIMLVTKFLLPKFVENTQSEGFKLFQRVLYTGAIIGLGIGLVSGSYLADFPSKILGIKPFALSNAVAQLFSTPTSLIVVAIIIGFIHINIAHVFAFILALKAKNKGVVIAKGGLFLFELFTLLYVAQIALGVMSGMGRAFLYGMYASLGMLAVGIIIQNGFFGAFLWIFEITGLLGDALSYSRLAGVALAGFYLGVSINMMAGIFRSLLPTPVGLVLGTLAAFFVLVFGHFINTILSIQSGFIHSLRLCLVEFMFKFYEGGGSKYNPFSLRARKSLVIREKS